MTSSSVQLIQGLGKGEVVLASSRPPVTADANCHRQATPSRAAATSPAAATAATASPTRLPDGSTRTKPGSSHTAQRVRCARTVSATTTNRDSHPRTVDRHAPTAVAIGRCPNPAARSSNARPIVAAQSPRRASIVAGNSTCVTPQPRHRPRRGRTRARRRRPTARSRAHPHGANHASRHVGHRNDPATSSDSTRTGSGLTVVTAAPIAARSPPGCPPRLGREGFALHKDRPTLPRNDEQGKLTAAQPSSTPLSFYTAAVLTPRGAQQWVPGLKQVSDDACYRAMDWLLEVHDEFENDSLIWPQLRPE
jgi:hypothetical protein